MERKNEDQQGRAMQTLHDPATRNHRQGSQHDTKQKQDRAQGKLRILTLMYRL
jgi:hypothetical protein